MLATESLFAMVFVLAFFGALFGIFYLRARVNLAMIDKGFNPKKDTAQPKPFVNLRDGLLLLGAGIGFMCGYFIDTVILDHKVVTERYSTDSTGRIINGNIEGSKVTESVSGFGSKVEMRSSTSNGIQNHTSVTDQREPLIYFAMIAIGGGIGLILSYRIEKKQWLDKKTERQNL